MKIAVICANGKAGSLITEEAVNRGLDVTAVVRGENHSTAKKAIVKDLFTLTKEELAAFDVIVDACGGWTAEAIPAIPKAANICAICCRAVTSGSSLWVAREAFMSTPSTPSPLPTAQISRMPSSRLPRRIRNCSMP